MLDKHYIQTCICVYSNLTIHIYKPNLATAMPNAMDVKPVLSQARYVRSLAR